MTNHFFALRVALSLAILTLPAALRSAVAQQPARQLAPGVVTVIPVQPEEEETFTGPLALEGVPAKDWTPNYTAKTDIAAEKSKTVVLRRGVWNLEFAFK